MDSATALEKTVAATPLTDERSRGRGAQRVMMSAYLMRGGGGGGGGGGGPHSKNPRVGWRTVLSLLRRYLRIHHQRRIQRSDPLRVTIHHAEAQVVVSGRKDDFLFAGKPYTSLET